MIGLLRRLRRKTPPARRLIDCLGGPLNPAVALLFHEPSAGRLVVDRHGRIVRASEKLRRLVGPATDLSPGTPLPLLFAEAEREQAWGELAPMLRGQLSPGPQRAVAVRLAGPAPEPLTVSIIAAPVREADGTASGALLAVHDISLQTRLEVQLLHSQRLQAAGQLAGGVAHDFNNLLTAILGAAEAIGGRLALDEETREDLAHIRASAERGATLVRQLLAFGRRQTLQPRVLATNDVLADMRGLLRRVLGSNVQIDLALEQPGHRVRADPTALDQVLLNLAVNARDAMPQGGVLTLRSGHITLYRPLPRGPETIPPGRYVMIEVADTGVGIPPDLQARIFEPFFTTRREQGGSGLGLATVHGIVRQSAGFLGVESDVGKGTRLRIYLPRWDGEEVMIPSLPPPPALLAEPSPSPQSRRGAVLLVEDETVVRRIVERALTRAGWQVFSADCAESALALLGGASVARLVAVVTDLMMPGQDGTALVRAVRETLAAPALPAILVSGYAGEEVQRQMAATLGPATVFLPKPYEVKELAARLAEVTALP